MIEKLSIAGIESPSENLSALEEFMQKSYELRRNVLSDKYELRERSEVTKPFRPVTKEAINSIIRRVKRELGDDTGLKTAIEEIIYSEETLEYDPITHYLNTLPVWDGTDRVRPFFNRLPGLDETQLTRLRTWLRSAVAHWLGIDHLHGNENIVTLIGAQGCGKSTFCAQLLPEHLRGYYLDHVNLANKFDKEMALTNNLIVNIDELDQIKAGKQAELKQMLSKIEINGRPIFGKVQRNRRRFASFVATTNNPRPLNDPTGSRRYLCVEIPRDSLIDTLSPIDYDQLYAQVLYEVRDLKLPYWFSNAEVRAIEQHNISYQHVNDLESMLTTCFRRPETNELVLPLLTRDIVGILSRSFPEIQRTQGMNIKVGRLLKAMNFERKENAQGTVYYLVPIVSAA